MELIRLYPYAIIAMILIICIVLILEWRSNIKKKKLCYNCVHRINCLVFQTEGAKKKCNDFYPEN